MVAAVLAPGALAQDYPRTSDGKPDFQGVWSSAWLTPLERPPQATSLILSPSEAEALFQTLWAERDARDPLGPLESIDVRSLVIVDGRARSSLIVDPADGKLPLTAAARARRGPPPLPGLDGPEQRPPPERCNVTSNAVAPLFVLPAGNMRQIVQTPDHFMALAETYGIARVIPLKDGVPAPAASGRGRWEGDTLVIETSGFAETDRIRVAPYANFPISPRSKIVERFQRTSRDEILYSFTVEDSALYTAPWTAEMSLLRSDEKIYEWACHEGNYAMSNMLRGARLEEQRAAAKDKRK